MAGGAGAGVMAKHLWRTLSPCWRQLWEQSREAQVATPVERLGSAEGKEEKKKEVEKKKSVLPIANYLLLVRKLEVVLEV